MSEHVTRLLNEIEGGDPSAGEKLLPYVYQELRKIAAAKLSHEKPGQTLQPTDLVHEAWMRLGGGQQQWDSRRHFFAAAAESMRRILVERARRKARQCHGGGLQRVDIEQIDVAMEDNEETVLFVDDALKRLAIVDPVCAQLVALRFFGGISNKDAAALLGLSERTAKRNVQYARAWLGREIERLNSLDDCGQRK